MTKQIVAGITASAVLVTVFLMLAEFASAATYEISWYTIDGGGGRSSGGPYVLTGTIGQPDADWSEGGDYELLGGFWPGGPLCFVEFDDFARFAQYWLYTGSDIPADLYGDDVVNFKDLRKLAESWLCYCPVPWPLK